MVSNATSNTGTSASEIEPFVSTKSCLVIATGSKWCSGNDFDQNVSMGQQYGMPYTPLSGVGDKAYENNNCGEQCAQVGVMKGKTYFTVMVQEDLNHTRSAVALARKVAHRM